MHILGQAAGLGLVTGMRSMMGLRMLAMSAREGAFDDRSGKLWQALRSPVTGAVLGALAAGEIVADKLPGVPSRLEPVPLVGRLLLGALVGGVIATGGKRGRTNVVGALLGATAAVAGAYAGNRARSWLQSKSSLADPIAAVLEDVVAVSLGAAVKPT